MESTPAYALYKQDIESLRQEVREYGQVIKASNGYIKTLQSSVEAGSCAVCTVIIFLFLGSWMFSHIRFV